MPETSELAILAIGDMAAAEFREAEAIMERTGRVTCVPDATSSLVVLRQVETDPAVIVLTQARPGGFSQAQVDALRAAAPVARMVGLLGPWCEGEARTGRPSPGVIRLYWHQWRASFAREFGRLCRGETSTWSLPATASEEERLLALVEHRSIRGSSTDRETPADLTRSVRSTPVGAGVAAPPVLAIFTLRFEMYDWLAAASMRRGYRPSWFRQHTVLAPRRIAAAVFDAPDNVEEQRESLRLLVAAVGPAPVVALTDFPRVHDRDRLLALGAAAVLSKPVLIEDLFWEIDSRTILEDRPTG